MRVLKKRLMVVPILVCGYAVCGYALGIGAGDLILQKPVGGGVLYLFENGANPRIEVLLNYPAQYTPVPSYDKVNNRIFFYNKEDDSQWYVDVLSNEQEFKEADFVPPDMGVSALAPDGSSIILWRLDYGDIFIEENPLFPKPIPENIINIWKPYMLYRYDYSTGDIERLTFSYGQTFGWVTPDGECLLYRRRIGGPFNVAIPPTLIFCKIDGTAKYDLGRPFEEAGVYLWDLFSKDQLVPEVVTRDNGERGYVLNFLDDPWGKRSEEGVAKFWTVYLSHPGDRLVYDIQSREIKLTPGLNAEIIRTVPGSGDKLYLECVDEEKNKSYYFYDAAKGELERILLEGNYEIFAVF